MSFIKKYLLVALGFGLAGAIGAAFGTGTAQAGVSTLVSVVNPNTSPVPSLNVTDPGRIAYQATVVNTGNCSGTACTFLFPSVPAGHRLVVQHASASVGYNAVPGTIQVFFVSSQNNQVLSVFFAPVQILGMGGGVLSSAFDQPELFYVDSSTSVSGFVTLAGNGATFAGGGVTHVMTLTGYELDCTVAACAPIATQ